MARILGIDYGEKRMGIAISDANNTIALPMRTIVGDEQLFLTEIAKIIDEYRVDTIVVGLPRHLSGKDSETTAKVRKFANNLAKFGVKIIFVDEWFTSKIAEESIREDGKKPSKRKELVDKVAASLILQGFLERNRDRNEDTDR